MDTACTAETSAALPITTTCKHPKTELTSTANHREKLNHKLVVVVVVVFLFTSFK
jgi:hypothetical protein